MLCGHGLSQNSLLDKFKSFSMLTKRFSAAVISPVYGATENLTWISPSQFYQEKSRSYQRSSGTAAYIFPLLIKSRTFLMNGPSAWCPLSWHNVTELALEAKESVLLWQTNRETPAHVPEHVLFRAEGCGAAALNTPKQGGGGVLSARACVRACG